MDEVAFAPDQSPEAVQVSLFVGVLQSRFILSGSSTLAGPFNVTVGSSLNLPYQIQTFPSEPLSAPKYLVGFAIESETAPKKPKL